MNMLARLATTETVTEERDVVGGSSGPLDSGVYSATVTMAYLGESAGGAMSLSLHLRTDDGKDLRQTLWMSSGRAKGSKTYYETKDGEKKYLPGFTLANSLCLLTLGKEISDLETEPKVIGLYSFDVKAEVPTKVDVLTDLLGKEISVALFKQTVDKNVKDAAGNYVPSGETREENEIDKFFRARDSMTVAEIRAQAPEAVFISTWREKWAGKSRNKSKGIGGNTGIAGAPAGAQQKPKTSLFA